MARKRAGLAVQDVAPQGVLRPLKQPLYDTTTYPIAGAAQMMFFTIPLGQAMPVTGVAKQLSDTNLQQASQLGTPNTFELYGFKFKYQQSVLIANDYALMYDTGVFTFSFGQQRPWLQVPLTRIPAGPMPTGNNTLDGNAAPGAEIYSLANGPSTTDSYYNFTIKRQSILINSNEVFSASITYPLGVVAVTANARIQVYLVGIYNRAI